MALVDDNVFPKVILGAQTTNPAAPSDSSWKVFSKVDGVYARSSNTVLGPFSSGGGSLTVSDEGIALSTAATTIDFVGAGVTASGTGATKTITISSGGGTTYGQALAYPTTFTGDNDTFASWSNWADVSAFDTADIQNSTVGRLITLGANKDQKKRFTLGTAKAAAFDFRWTGVLPDIMYWSAAGDVYLDLALKTSADAHIAGWRFLPQVTFGAGNGGLGDCYIEAVVSGSVISTNTIPRLPRGMACTLRITRDGSNNTLFYVGMGTAPVALGRLLDSSTNLAYGGAPSGTVARAEILIHTPASVGGTVANQMFIDAFESV